MLQVLKGIQAYTEPRPALVFITSAGVERNAKIGDDEAARKKDIPIVQLNPGGVLNHKYAGEWAVRTSELPYTVIRSTGDRLKVFVVSQESMGAIYILQLSPGSMSTMISPESKLCTHNSCLIRYTGELPGCRHPTSDVLETCMQV